MLRRVCGAPGTYGGLDALVFNSTSSAGGLQLDFRSNGDLDAGNGFLLQYRLVDVAELPRALRHTCTCTCTYT